MTHGAGMLPLRWVCPPAGQCFLALAPRTCGPSLSAAGRDDPRRRGAIGAGRYIPLRGGACLPPAPMTCGPSLYIGGGQAYPRRAAPLLTLAALFLGHSAGVAMPAGGAPDDLRAVSIGGGAADPRRGHAALAVGMLPCGRGLACVCSR